MEESKTGSRRDFLAQVSMWTGLVAAYGVLGVQSLLFLVPRRQGPKTRLLFVGQTSDFPVGSVRSVPDLQGTPILVRRDAGGFRAFSSVCPHLGCRVRWEDEEKRFFCPCHRGVFDVEGVGTAGPPADGGQRLAEVPLKVDEDGGVVYLEVRDVKRRRT